MFISFRCSRLGSCLRPSAARVYRRRQCLVLQYAQINLFSRDVETCYDYIIVGAGTAGCVLANRLSQNPKVRVLLLEAGPKDTKFFIHVPVGYLWSIGNPSVDWMYKTQPCEGLGGRSLIYPRGKVLGGSSSINGMIYMRGQARDYEQWAHLTGDPSWSWKEVLPYFLKSEDHHSGQDADRAWHGVGGEWRVERQRTSWQILDAFQDACAEHGIPKTADFNRGNNFGSSYFEVNQRRGVRWNTAKAFLHSVCRGRPNLTVITKCYATRLLLEEGGSGLRAAGVEYFVEGQESTLLQAHAGLRTVLSAGSLGSTQLLQLSGIGPPSVLEQHHIPVQQPLPGVGANLQDHLQIRLAFKVSNTRTLNEWYASWIGKVEMFLQYVLFRRGPLTSAPSQLGVFASSNTGEETPNLQYHVQPLSLDKFGDPLHTFPAFTASVCNLRPTSRGYVRIQDRDPRSHPCIQPNYLATEDDRKVAADSIRLTRRLVLGSKALEPFKPSEFVPGQSCQTEEQLVEAAGRVSSTIFHPVGTARMGRSLEADPLSVVNAKSLGVHGVAALSVGDASIMPTITSGNPNSPTIMIAERLAEKLHSQHGTR